MTTTTFATAPLRAKGELGDLTADDVCSPETLYKHVLGIEPGSAASSLVAFSYAPFEGEHGEDKPDNVINLRMSPMEFVYLQQFWLEIIDYVNEGASSNTNPTHQMWPAPPIESSSIQLLNF